MTNKYLGKIAESGKEPGNGFGDRLINAFGATSLGTLAAGTAMYPIGRKHGNISRTIQKSPSASGSDMGTIRKFIRDNKLSGKVTFNHRDTPVERAVGSANSLYGHAIHSANIHETPAYLKVKGMKRGVVVGAKKLVYGRNGSTKLKAINTDVIMHELGHAKDFNKHFGVKSIETKLARTPKAIAAFDLAAMGMLTSKKGKTRDYAPAVAAIPGALVLRQEAAANINAYKGIKASKGIEAANKFAKGVAKHNMINYAAISAIPVAATYLAKKIMDKANPREK